MYILALKITLRIEGSFSLKDKRRVIKSVIHRIQTRHKVSIAEVGQQDMLNLSEIGICLVQSDFTLLRSMADKIINHIDERDEVEIIQIDELEEQL